ncbi:MAG: hypothetical protein GX127_05490 [Eubacteriaceae bacterium]|jgi:foldase protein PrsA|nr:hypothetical protein [Eubacteriaceae bacterium]
MKKKKMLAILTLLLTMVYLAGCGMVAVNPEKDNAQTIAEIDGNNMEKSLFQNYMAYYEMNLSMQNKALPEDKDLQNMKTEIFNELLNLAVLAHNGEKENLEVDEKAIDGQVKGLIENVKHNTNFEKILKKYNSNEESFEKAIKTILTNGEMAQKAMNKKIEVMQKEPEKEFNAIIGTIGEEDIKKGEYQYYYIKQLMGSVAMTGKGLPTDSEGKKQVHEQVVQSLVQKKALKNYADQENLKIDEKKVKENEAAIQGQWQNFFPDGEGLETFLKTYFMTEKQFKDFQKEDAESQWIHAHIKREIEDKQEVSDKEIKETFDKKKDTYNAKTVSAFHILAEKKEDAEEIYNNVKDINSKEDFAKVVETYQSDEKVKEAADLGSFDEKRMVPEFSKAAFNAEKDVPTQPVQSEFGYHIIYVYEKPDTKEVTLEDKKAEIESQLKSQKASEELTKTLEDLKKKENAKIDEVLSAQDAFLQELKAEYNVKTYEKRLK